MREEQVEFFGEGLRIAALIRRPDGPAPHPSGHPEIVQGQRGLGGEPDLAAYHEVFVRAGFVVVSPRQLIEIEAIAVVETPPE